jgi:TatD DNase family protein
LITFLTDNNKVFIYKPSFHNFFTQPEYLLTNSKNDMTHQKKPSLQLIDTHCHLDMESFTGDLDQIIEDGLQAGVKTIITIGIDLDSSLKAVQLAEQYPSVFATVGVHPHDADKVTDQDLTIIRELAGHEKVIGYGEIGLDYAKMYAKKERQKEIFLRQLVMAKELDLPIIIHDRDAHTDTLHALNSFAPFPAGGVMHCFSGNLDFARQVIELGFFISIPGIVTFKNAHSLHEVASKVPADSLLLETDAPFLTPVPYRGKRNEPARIIHTAAKVAKLRDVSIEELAVITCRNAETLFNIPACPRAYQINNKKTKEQKT